MKHTPEPWIIVARGNEADGVDYFVNQEKDDSISGTIASWLSREDARRIVACVNACAGMSDEAMALAVENGGMKAVIGFARDLERQRDQLLAALKEAKEQVEELCLAFSVPIPDASMTRYEDAIASVEGGNKS